MKRTHLAGVAVTLALSTAGCLDQSATTSLTAGSVAVATTPDPAGSSAASWQMPRQISPVPEAAEGQREQTVLAYIPNTGFVRGTREAVAAIGAPLEAAPGPNRTVEACREVVESEAAKIGAREVEAVSAGPHRRNRQGQYEGPVRMRIIYATSNGFEVRQATMTCIVDARGRIVDARAAA